MSRAARPTELSEREQILQGLEPLFARAKLEGLWFYCTYQGLWMTPEALAKEQAQNRFIWGITNWQLRDPRERVSEARRGADLAADNARRIEQEYQVWKAGRR